MSLKAVSKSIGCSDHNLVAISRKTKVPKAGPNIVYKRSYVYDVNHICWPVVCNEEQPDDAIDTFMKQFIPVTVKSPWIDEELKNCMVERDEEKGMAIKSVSPTDWQMYCKFRNHVTKLNKK